MTTTTTALRRDALLAAFAAEARTAAEAARAVAEARQRPLDALGDDEVLHGLVRLRAAVRAARANAVPDQRAPTD